jgi:hypothetical protein
MEHDEHAALERPSRPARPATPPETKDGPRRTKRDQDRIEIIERIYR